jgi:rfaE bifunctional protein nucleotidyltransferase chain/domain
VTPPVLGGGAAPDTCGAGDRFAGELTALLALGASIPEAAAAAVTAASRFVLAGAAGALSASPVTGSSGTVPDQAVPDGSIPGWEAVDGVTRRVREHDGVVVATGGVFDLLHVGHVSYLERARALGDALVVLVNGDDSVRRLKGPDRPLQPLADRMAVLTALGCVDAVVAFDDDTPVSALERLRPDLWVKGGDYAGVTLPEAAVLADWGGEVVVLPYLDGRSTTQLITRARGPSRGEVTPQGRPRVPPRVPAPPGAPDVASREGAP